MSVEMRNPESLNIGLPEASEASIGADPLWQEDPLAKAAYSSNPGFVKGAAGGQPVISAETSMFTRAYSTDGSIEGPALVEALEAAYLHAPVSPKERLARKPLETPVEPTLALDGLRWLIPQLGKGSDLRRAATRARARLSEEEEINAGREQTAQYYASAMDRITAEQAAEKTRLKELDSARKAELSQAISAIGESAPDGLMEHLHTEKVVELCDELSIREESGALVAKESPYFRFKLAKRMEEYMRDPQELVNDVFVVTLVDEISEADYDSKEQNPVYAYLYKILSTVSDVAEESRYDIEDFSPEIVAKWAAIATTLPADLTISQFYEACDDNDTMYLTLRWIMKQGEVISTNTLREIAAQQPDKFVDSLYMFAKNSLDPAHEVVNNVTLTAIEACLDPEQEPLPKIILSTSTGTTDKRLRQKALDLQTTLICLGIPSEKLGIRQPSGDRTGNPSQIPISPRIKRALDKLPASVMINESSDYDPVAFQQRANSMHMDFLAEFEDYVATPQGEQGTLLGKFLAQARRDGKLDGKFASVMSKTAQSRLQSKPGDLPGLPGFVADRLFLMPEASKLGL